MIIYKARLKDFRYDINNFLLNNKITKELQDRLGIRVSESEINSWMNSLPSILNLLPEEKNDNRYILCEYNIPTSNKRIDFIILGKNKDNFPSAFIIELKQWTQIKEISFNEFYVGKYTSGHPSFQVKNYMDILNHAMGLSDTINLKGAAFLHNRINDKDISALFKNKYKDILKEIPLYTDASKKELSIAIKEQTINMDGTEALKLFDKATWNPTKTLENIIKNDFKNIKLIGSQKLIYEKIKSFIQLPSSLNQKMTFLISGNPGSGKTIMAFKIFNLMNQHSIKNKLGPVQMMIPGQEVRATFQYKFKDHFIANSISGSQMKKGFSAVIIDEGHKAIARNNGEINYQKNYSKIKIAIVFIDDDQVINKKGITKMEVKEIAIQNGHQIFEYTIEENFRSCGEKAFLDWIDYIFYNRKTKIGNQIQEQYQYNNNFQMYELYGYKTGKEFSKNYLKYRKDKNKTTRITSLLARGFYIGPADSKGFPKATFIIGSKEFIWNPVGEWAAKIKGYKTDIWSDYNSEVKRYSQDRKSFLLGDPDPRFIAYFNHIQGYEFDNIFVYIPNIFTYDKVNKIIIFHRDRLGKEALIPHTWTTNSKSKKVVGKSENEIYEINKRFFINRIKVMLTRGLTSTHVFAEDNDLNKFIFDSIIKKSKI